eukprot:TRINITY_DN103102_c0_g1_i1.p1 TRINITY_DN103102_c0_g1~~TRINITY_DN103102_c0_g1_i1.p1  ORF type:complete len:435 (-),score=84.82 TRINITY_DN103102_c0_g1_i1:210-1514(-)
MDFASPEERSSIGPWQQSRGEEAEDEELDLTCAICFEEVEGSGSFVSLPCECHVNYCGGCWSRALATSITVVGQAQCPSCRTGFTVDYNPQVRSLVYSVLTDHCSTAADHAGAHIHDSTPDSSAFEIIRTDNQHHSADGDGEDGWRSRLYGKTKAVQVELLREYGACIQKRAMIEDEPEVVEPSCVCGAPLEHVGARLRILRMLDAADSSWRERVGRKSEKVIKSMLRSSVIVCDICGADATTCGSVWTCRDGPHTLLHPAAYDICEDCFCHCAGLEADRRGLPPVADDAPPPCEEDSRSQSKSSTSSCPAKAAGLDVLKLGQKLSKVVKWGRTCSVSSSSASAIFSRQTSLDSSVSGSTLSRQVSLDSTDAPDVGSAATTPSDFEDSSRSANSELGSEPSLQSKRSRVKSFMRLMSFACRGPPKSTEGPEERL